MEASDHSCDFTEENQSVDAPVQTEPSVSSTFHANEDSEADSDPLGKSSDVLAKGLSSMLSTIIRDFDCRAQETFKSQDQLFFAIDRLTRELDQLLEDAPLPFIMQHAAKISSVRKRVSSLNLILKSIQGRIDNIDRMLSIGITHDPVILSDSPEASWLFWLDIESRSNLLLGATEDFDSPNCCSGYNMILTSP